MSKLLSSIVLLCVLVSSVAAEPYRTNKKFGLGIMLGAPTGLSGKYFLSRDTALDFGVGGIGYYRGRDGIHAHLDYLLHPFSFVNDSAFSMPLYFGLGGRIFSFDSTYRNTNDDGFAIGVRAPLGVALDFRRVPFDIFFELALVMDFFVGYHDGFGVDVNGAIGARYYF